MESFIDLCVTDILKKHSGHLANTTVIFPSKRAIVFFKKSMGRHIDAPIFLPRMTTIQDFCITRQDSAIPDDFTLVYILYQSYQKVYQAQQKNSPQKGAYEETFEDFYPWGEMLLSDFDDIDKYLINAKDIFTNIGDIKEIDSIFDYLTKEQKDMIARFWDTTKLEANADKNDVRRKFIDFWNLLPRIYEDFKQSLQQEKLCYEGMALRSVAESDITTKDSVFGNSTYIFLGFNALSECEKKIFTFLKDRKQAFFYWDYDTYYKDDKAHEAGIFVRKNITLFPNELSQDIFNNIRGNKNIRIIKTPNEIAQAKLCGELLQDLDPTHQYESTAIILADEKLVVPVIKSLPVNKYNVTLGYPIRSSAAYTLFESMLSLYANKRNDMLYYKDVLKICENPLIPTKIHQQTKAIQDSIRENKKITISIKECGDALKFIFDLKTDLELYVGNLQETIKTICKEFASDKIDKSIFYTIYTELSVIQKIITKNNIQFQKIEFINSLLRKTLQGKNIAIEGQPLEGLQVLGILETRLLDFENIIITSVMDGNLPKTSLGGSFIPYNLRVAFGMPTIKEQSAMYSYYFYRTLQRSHNITLLYSENSGENQSEQSRFLLQLLYESPFKTNIGNGEEQNKDKIFDKITIEEYNYTVFPSNIKPISFAKNSPEVLAYFESLKKEYLSPTAFIKYLECGVKFYFAHIKGLKKPQEFDELPKPYDVGNYFHNTMEILYKDWEGKRIDAQVIDKILSNEQKIEEIILSVMKDDNAPQKIIDPKSREFLTTKKQIERFLTYEKGNPFTLIKVENQDSKIKIQGINLGGKIDRIDERNGIVRIVDYKTGNCKVDKLKDKLDCTIESLFYSENKKLQKEAFQILLYAYILKKIEPSKTYQPNLFFLQTINDPENRTTLKYNKKDVFTFDDTLKEDFEKALNEKLAELLDTKGTFEQTENIQNTCCYCDFKEFCGRNIEPQEY